MSFSGLLRAGRKQSRRQHSERGASMVEFALIAPLFFFILFGGIEMGLMFRSHLAIENMSRSAARVASIQRNNVDADREILGSIASLNGGLQGDIEKVIIFHAPTLDADLPAGCIDVNDEPITVSGFCNSYGTDFEDVANGLIDVEEGLTEAERSQWQNLGIYIEYSHPFATGMFDDVTLTSVTIEVVELDL